MNAFYAVRAGRSPGVYLNWNDCREQIEGYSGAVYKKFKTLAEAQQFMQEGALERDSIRFQRNKQQFAQEGWASAEPSTARGLKTAGKSGSGDVSAARLNGSEPALYTSLDRGSGVFAAAGSAAEPHDAELAALAPGECLAYVDGSFNARTGVYGYGVALLTREKCYTFQGSGTDAELASMRNVSGEIHGSMRAVEEALKLGFRSVAIYYDYMGIECWALGTWKTNKEGTRAYRAFMQEKARDIAISFRKVRAHTGVTYNEMVDRLAKEAVGLV